MAKQFFYKIGDDKIGPLNSQQLRVAAARGQVQHDTLIQVEEGGPTVPAYRLRGLFDKTGLAVVSPIGSPDIPNGGDEVTEKESTPTQTVELSSAGDWRRTLRNAIDRVLIIGGGIGWLGTLQPKPGFIVLFHYIMLITVLVGIVRACSSKWKKYHKWILSGGAIAAVCLVVLYGQHDYYEERWTGKKFEDTTYVDTHHRWSNKIVKRWFSFKEGTASGPMAGEVFNESPHGKWEYVSWKPYRKQYKFYWYGEEIAEGEWHLRSK